jgi:hypothetical protein
MQQEGLFPPKYDLLVLQTPSRVKQASFEKKDARNRAFLYSDTQPKAQIGLEERNRWGQQPAPSADGKHGNAVGVKCSTPTKINTKLMSNRTGACRGVDLEKLQNILIKYRRAN